MEMNRASLSIFSALLEARTGQRFDQDRRSRIGFALAPIMNAHGIANCDQLALDIAGEDGRQLSADIVDALLNNETYFFRDQQAFAQLPELLESIAVERRASKRLRIWSAGCSTGQELLSVAMQFAENKSRWQDWQIELLGTDVSQSVISRAQAAEYGQFEIQRGLSARRLLRWFHKVGDSWRADDRLRDMIKFERANLLDPSPAGPFDLILCRNVLLYFPKANRTKLLARIARALAPSGALMLGAGETVTDGPPCFEQVAGARSLYRLKPADTDDLSLTG